MSKIKELPELEQALYGLESTAMNFSIRFISDEQGRLAYNRQARAVANELLQEVKLGKRTARDAMYIAQEMRNNLMQMIRDTRTSEPTLAYAKGLKNEGKTIAWLLNRYSQKLYGLDFEYLKTPQQQNNVYLEIVKSSGRPSPKENALATKLGRAGRFFYVISIAVSVYSVASAENKVMETANQSAILGGGMLGSVAGGAVATIVCASTSVVCVSAFIIIFSFGAATASDFAFDQIFR